MHSYAKKIWTAAAAAVLMVGLTACGGDSTPAADSSTSGKAASGESDRAFGVDSSGMSTAIKAGTKADRVEFNDGTFRAHFESGSTEDTVAWTKCGVLQLLGEGENLLLVFPDGELDCSKRNAD